ncbi:hypothetical protein PGT21_020394 [Puccinia graminis f. sp. tritici]|uniref:Uncharacterized protein n=1 Tax=Puccinia graminis f. sp. tritici TaxID=56615 RepID=A0A5B0PIH1_PUCGR|nr:hypothetical protein PGT21_020394 [Puccinia graminis f. sp. tritici]KAA1136531.1 hypothetical protein PGTUg99_034785 [Puccinia graminis f. sp. tritici]
MEVQTLPFYTIRNKTPKLSLESFNNVIGLVGSGKTLFDEIRLQKPETATTKSNLVSSLPSRLDQHSSTISLKLVVFTTWIDGFDLKTTP